MKLGSKNRDVDSFVDQLKSEGETVQAGGPQGARGDSTASAPVRAENTQE